jgi:hypothetical protein
MVQRRKELTPMDLLKGAASQLGPFGANLAVGLQKTSTQVGPAIRQLSAITKRQLEAARPIEPTRPTPTGPFLKGIDQQIMRERPIGTPRILDPQDAIPKRSENELQRYVKEAMRAMPIGTDTSVEPTVTVIPRTKFHAMTGHPSPARTTGRNSIEVSDELFDLAPKQRREIVGHEVLHALKHFDVYGRMVGPPPHWAEQEANTFAGSFEPEGQAANRVQFSGLPQR